MITSLELPAATAPNSPPSGSAERLRNCSRVSASKITPSASSAASVILPAPGEGAPDLLPEPEPRASSLEGATEPSFDTGSCLDWLNAGAAVAKHASVTTTERSVETYFMVDL